MTPARALLTAALLSACLAACTNAKASLPPVPTAARAVRVARPAARIETGLARVTGTVKAKNEAVLAAKATGQIKRIVAGVGDRVKTGAVLVEMDPVNAQIALENARAAERLAAASLDAARTELRRGQELIASGSITGAAIDRLQTGAALAQAQADQARAGLRFAEQQLRDTSLRAPFDGLITRKFQNAGNTVTLMPVSPILAITDVDHLEVQLQVPEALEPFVSTGQLLEGLTTPGGLRFPARVRARSAAIDPVTRSVEVLADVLRGPARVMPGAIATVDLGSFAGGGLFVPATAVRSEGEQSWVFIASGGKAEKRAVKVARVHPGAYAVQSGLDAASEVIVEPGTLVAGEAVVKLAD